MSDYEKYLAERKKVHMQIYMKHLEGLSYTALAKLFDLSTARIGQIVIRIKKGEGK